MMDFLPEMHLSIRVLQGDGFSDTHQFTGGKFDFQTGIIQQDQSNEITLFSLLPAQQINIESRLISAFLAQKVGMSVST